MTSILFIMLLASVATALIAGAIRYLPRRTAALISAAIAAWLAYVGTLSVSGIVGDASLRPPGIAYILVPVFVFMIVVVVRSKAALRIALSVPLPLLIGAQVYRVGVELLFHRLWVDGMVPKMLTYQGANVDIVIGLSAPIAAWLSTKGRTGLKIALAWNALGLAVLANVAVRAALTAPGPFNLIHQELPNLAFGTFPFTFIPGFFAPFAVALHFLAIRSSRARLKGKMRTISLGIAPFMLRGR